MKTIYAIRDTIANDLVGTQMYILFVFRTDQQAERYFADAILEPTSMLAKHPSDYELIKIGDLDDEGNIIKEHGPEVVTTGDTLIAAQTPKTEESLRDFHSKTGN